MSLGKKVFSGAFLLFIRKTWGNVVNLIVMAFLARLLSKEDFGLLAVSSVFLSIINTLATSGIAEYVVYYDGDDRLEKLNAAFWLNFLLTVAVVAVAATVGIFWADFYQNPKIYGLLLLLSVSFFFEMGSTIPKALLRKDLEYKSLVFYTTVSMTFVSVGKLGAAFAGFGVYSLALPQAIVSPFLMLAFFIKTRWKPFIYIGLGHFKSIFTYTRHIIGGRVLTKLVNEGDNLIVGKFIGLEGLGIYTLAFQLANLVTTNVVFIANDIFLPLFSKVKGDIKRLRELYRRMIRFLSFISFPLITALAISAEPIVYYIYGHKWADVVLPFQVMCVFALGRSLSSPSSALFSAVGRPDVGFKFAAFFTPVFLLSVFFGSQFGIVGVAMFTTFARLLGSITSLHISLRFIQLSLLNLVTLVRSNLTSTLFILVLSLVINFFLQNKLLVSMLILPVIVYAHFLIQRFIFFNEFVSFLSELKHYIPGKFKPVVISLFFLKSTVLES